MKLHSRDNCPLCQSPEYRVVCHYGEVNVLCCKSCRLVYLNPYVTSLEMAEIYASPEKLAEYFPFCDNYFEDGLERNRKTHTWKIYHRWSSRLKSLTEGNKLLDVGCGTGQFLSAAREDGWDVSGLDFETEQSKSLKANGFNILFEDFLKMEFAKEKYDVVTLWDVLEHFEDPHQAIGQCKKVLKSEGRLLLACPKENSLLAFCARFGWHLSFKKFEYPLKVVYLLDHPLFYSLETITRLLTQHGFQVEEVELDETDLGRVDFHPIIKLVLRVLFLIAKPFKLHNRLIVSARFPKE